MKTSQMYDLYCDVTYDMPCAQQAQRCKVMGGFRIGRAPAVHCEMFRKVGESNDVAAVPSTGCDLVELVVFTC